jgi:hypothetical protein
MTSKYATQLGYNYDNVMEYYEAIALNYYTSMVKAASAQHSSLYSTARSLAGNKYTKSTSDQLFAQAIAAEAQANINIAQLKLEYQAKVDSIELNWNQSKIVFANINGTSHYYQVPFHAGLNINNGTVLINFMGKNFPIHETTYDEAVTIQESNQWETMNCNTSQGVTISNSVFVNNGNIYGADDDGDVVMGQTIIGNKIVTGNGNVVGNNNNVSYVDSDCDVVRGRHIKYQINM